MSNFAYPILQKSIIKSNHSNITNTMTKNRRYTFTNNGRYNQDKFNTN